MAATIEHTTELVKAATAAVQLKLRMQKREFRRRAFEQLHIKKVEKAEASIENALAPMFDEQIRSAQKALKKFAKSKGEDYVWGGEASTLAKKVFDPSEWDEDLINRALPPIAKTMAEEMLRFLKELGVDPRRKRARKAFCPTGPGGGVDPTCGSGSSGSSAEKPKVRNTKPVLASDISGVVPSKSGKPIKAAKYKGYHVTSLAAAESIIKNGFDLTKVKPRWVNDYAVSITSGTLKSAADYFTPTDGKFNTAKYVVLEVSGVGRFGDPGDIDVPIYSGAQAFTRGAVKAGYDGAKGNSSIRYIYNPKSIGTIRIVPIEELDDAGVPVKSAPLEFNKASTASEWLGDWSIDLEDVEFDTPNGPVSMGFATEYPNWMKAEIRKQLEESFAQDYWAKVNETTFGDIEGFLKTGLKDGWSIKRMADEIIPKLMNDGHYAEWRAKTIARTESGNALNGARVRSANQLINLVPELPMKKVWLSVLGTTTRKTHADLDGVPAKADRWKLAGIMVRWPADITLPPEERCNCQCTVIVEFGMSDESAEELLADYGDRLAEEEEYQASQGNN